MTNPLHTTSPKTAPWRLLPFSDAPMGRQLALSEALLAELPTMGRPALRWYLPREPALVLGNGQKPGLVNLAACHEQGVRVYRRTSGGAAVLVTSDLLSLDVILPDTHPLATTDVVQAYRWIGELWQDALQTLGVAKAQAIPTEAVRAIPPLPKDDVLRLACYGTLSPWEVVVGKRKLVGLCQVRRRGGALYQTALHLRFDPKALGQFLDLNNNRRKTLATRLHNAAVGLDAAAGREIASDEVMRAVEETLAERFSARLIASDYTAAELAAADRVQRERFQPVQQ
jgi:lipoate-protein ligase A